METTTIKAFADELEKISSDLTEAARAHIAKKNFALTPNQSTTGKPAYPIEDKAHAKAALGLVGMRGSEEQKAEVRKDVAQKYPDMLKDKEKTANDAAELAGLGVLAVPSVDSLQARVRARMAHDQSPDAIKKRQVLPSGAKDVMEIGGLGTLAAPYLAKRFK